MELTKSFAYSQANDILSSFDDRLRRYATKQLTKVRDVWLMQKYCRLPNSYMTNLVFLATEVYPCY